MKKINKKIITIIIVFIITLSLIAKFSYAANTNLTSNEYEIIDNTIIAVPTTKELKVSEIKNHISISNDIEIYNKNNEKLNDNDLVGTGYKLKNSSNTYNIVVLGDVTGDGSISLGDVAKLYNSYKGKVKLRGFYLNSAKITRGDNLQLGDVSKLYNYYKKDNASLAYHIKRLSFNEEDVSIKISNKDLTNLYTKTFSITNNGNDSETYDLYLSELLNDVSNKDKFVYTLTCSEANININEKELPSESSKLLENISIESKKTHNYVLKIILKDEIASFDDDLNSGFEAKLTIDKKVDYKDNLPRDGRGISIDNIVSNVEELKKLNAKVNEVVETLGYYEENDQGGAYYTIEEKNKQTIDDGKYILLDNGLVANLMSIDNAYNLKQFGAKGDSISDDSNYIKNAFKQINNNTLFVPKGTYMFGNSVSIYNKTNIQIIGEGEESQFKAMKDLPRGKVLLYFSEIKDIVINHISLDGNIEENPLGDVYNAQGGIELISFWGARNVIVDDCTFEDNAYAAIGLMFGTTIDGVYNSRYSNNKFLSTDCTVISMGRKNIDYLLYENNYVDGHDNSEPVSIFGASGGVSSHIKVNNNVIKNKTYGSSVFIGGYSDEDHTEIHDVIVTNNRFEKSASGAIIRHATNVLVANNYIDSVGKGIEASNSSNVEIRDNTIINTKRQGIHIDTTTDVSIHGNTIKDCGWANENFFYVDIRNENTNLDIYENNIIRTNPDLYLYAIIVYGSGANIHDNYFEDVGIVLYVDSHDNIVKNNNTRVSNRGTNNIVE